MALRLLVVSAVLCYSLVAASPLADADSALKARQAAVSPVPAATIASYRPYAFYAAAAYCEPANTLAWNCGLNCNSNPTFTAVASGGNGATEQYWYVGYDSTLGSVIVGRQGTDSSKIIPVLTNANFRPDDLSPTLFPGLPSGIRAHDGFTDSHARSSAKILAAVRTALSRFSTSKIAVVGHSLGGALALLDGMSLATTLPSATVSITTFGAPRVGNQAFVNYVNSKFAGRVSRIINRDDVVPILPGRFLGFAHVNGEKRIQENGSWVNCPGQDNTDDRCTVGAVGSIFEGNTGDHSGPYTGTGVVDMGC